MQILPQRNFVLFIATFVAFLGINTVVTGQTTVGPNNPGTGTNVTGIGNRAWANPENIASSSTTDYARVTINNNSSNYLQGTNYGFSIPAGATIQGIQVAIGKLRESGSGNQMYDNQVRLLKNGSIIGSNYAQTTNNWTRDQGTPAVVNYGGQNDLWGTSWTPAEINAGNFGVAISARTTQNIYASVYSMRVQVTYTIGSSPSNYCVSNGYDSPYITAGIRLVNFNTLNNTIPDGNNGYSDFTAISTTVTKGLSYNLTVNINTQGNFEFYNHAWIDWNQDGDFSDTGESFNLGTARNVNNGRTSLSPLSITIPTNAIIGSTRMRVTSKVNGDPTFCETNFFGEVEDYTINVAPAISITTGIISPTSYCSGASVSVPYSISGTFIAGNVFTAQISNATGNFAVPVTIGSLTSTAAGIISGTIPVGTASGNGYRIRVVSNNPGISGTDNGSNLTVNIVPTAPTIGTITQPTCTTATGSVILNGLPATGTWVLTQSPGGITSTGTGSSATISGLTPDSYTYKVTNANGCISSDSANVLINTPPTTPAPTVGTITQPTCSTATGSVVLNGLPSGSWELTRSPGNIVTTGTGTSKTISNLSPGTYTYTVNDSNIGTGLKADYFNNMTHSGTPALTRTDATVNFDWGNGNPGAPIGNDNFSVRWTGQIQPLYSENYTFTTRSDDGIRLWVNGTQIINNWTDHGPTNNTGTISLTAGVKYDIVLEFYENGGGAVAQLSWNSASQTNQIIPQSQLYPNAGGCSSAPSANVAINAQPLPPTAVLTGSATICEGESTDITLNFTGPGSSWDVTGSIDSDPFTIHITENPFTLPVTPNTTTTYSILSATGANGCTNNSINSSVTITVLPALQNNTINQDQTVCEGFNPQTLTGSNVTGGDGTYSYLWESSTTSNSAGFNPAAGTNSSLNYNPGNLSQTTWFRRTVSSASCSGNNSNVVEITLNQPIINNQLSFSNGISGTLCGTANENGVVNLSAPAETVFNYVNFASYGTPGGTCGNFTVNSNCHALTSRTVTETYLLGNNTAAILATNGVFGDPCVGTGKRLYVQASYSQPICNGTDPGTISGTLPSGGDGNYTYLWESSISGPDSGFTPATGLNTTQNFNPGILAITTWFKRTVTSSNCSDESPVILISVKQDNIWTGATDTDWNTPSNWACNSVPTLSINVLIPSGLSKYPLLEIGTLGLSKDITIENGASVHIVDNLLLIGGAMTNQGIFNTENGSLAFVGTTTQTILSGAFENNSLQNLIIYNEAGVISEAVINIKENLNVVLGTFSTGDQLTLLSDNTQTALIDGSGKGQVVGLVKMQRHLEVAFGYKYFSSPFNNSLVGDFSSYVNLVATFPNFYRYVENRNDGPGRDATGFETYVNPISNLNILEGYALNFGDILTSPKTVEISGTVNNGDQQITLFNNNGFYTQGFNLVGNPYPSPIDWNAATGWTKNNIDDALYFFTAGNTNMYTGTYASYVNGVQSADGLSSNIIPSMQGFFVHVTDTGIYPGSGTLGMTNEVRVADFSQEFLKTPESGKFMNLSKQVLKSREPEKAPLIRISAGFENQTKADPAVLYFPDFAKLSFEKDKDALKLMNTDTSVPNLYSLTPENNKLSISALPKPGSNEVKKIPLGLKTEKEGWMSIGLQDLENFSSDFNVYLIDSEKRIGQNLSRKPQYRFYSKSGQHDSRFYLIFSETELSDPAFAFDEPFSVKTLDGKVMVHMNLEPGQYGVIQASNITGQILDRKNVSGKQTLEIEGIKSSGVYFFSINLKDGMFSKKVLIQK